MTLQLLIATMNGQFFQRGYVPPFGNCLVINQVGDQRSEPEPSAREHVQVFHYREKGLSRSRNRALQHATTDLCLIGDDDVRYPQSAENIIVDAFNNNPSADIITFQAQTPDGALLNKRYAARQHGHTRRSIMHVSSCEIAFRTASIQSAGLRFDEHFGLGADFPTGEENIFLLDALRCGLNIRYIPVPVVVHSAHSSGSNFFNHDLIAAKGAMFCRMFGAASWLVSLVFAFKKYRLSNVSYRCFYRLMCRGSAAYREAR